MSYLGEYENIILISVRLPKDSQETRSITYMKMLEHMLIVITIDNLTYT